jgi:hypothetical protein
MKIEYTETKPEAKSPKYPFFALNGGYLILILGPGTKDDREDGIMLSGNGYHDPFTYRADWFSKYNEPFHGTITITV